MSYDFRYEVQDSIATVTFDRPVSFDPGAFQLRRAHEGIVDVNVVASLVGGRTVAVLTFSGPGTHDGSLPDGNYTLTMRGGLQRRFRS